MIEFGFSFILYIIFSLGKSLYKETAPNCFSNLLFVNYRYPIREHQAIFGKQLLLLSLCLKFLLERLQCSAVLDSEGFSGCRSKINTLCFVDIKH